MSDLHHWLQTPPGHNALAWEQAQLDAAVVDIFGYHALQLGLPALDALAANRMPHRWRAALTAPATPQNAATAVAAATATANAPRIALVTAPAALPFAEASLDLVALPHTLDHGPDPRAVLREVQRVLVHEGRAVITGVNPASLWGLSGALPTGNLVTPRRLRAWLQGTDLELETLRHGGHGIAPRAPQAPPARPGGWLDRQGARLWPALGALWCAIAVKRSRGVMLVGPPWKNQHATAGAQAGVAQRAEPVAERTPSAPAATPSDC